MRGKNLVAAAIIVLAIGGCTGEAGGSSSSRPPGLTSGQPTSMGSSGDSAAEQNPMSTGAEMQRAYVALTNQAASDQVLGVQAKFGQSIDVTLIKDGRVESWALRANSAQVSKQQLPAVLRPVATRDTVDLAVALSTLTPALTDCTNPWLDWEVSMLGEPKVRGRCLDGPIEPRTTVVAGTPLRTIDTRTAEGLNRMIAELVFLVRDGQVDLVELPSDLDGYEAVTSGKSEPLNDRSTCSYRVSRSRADLQDHCEAPDDTLRDFVLTGTTGTQLLATMTLVAQGAGLPIEDLDFEVLAGATAGQVVVYTQLPDQIVAFDTAGQPVTMG